LHFFKIIFNFKIFTFNAFKCSINDDFIHLTDFFNLNLIFHLFNFIKLISEDFKNVFLYVVLLFKINLLRSSPLNSKQPETFLLFSKF